MFITVGSEEAECRSMYASKACNDSTMTDAYTGIEQLEWHQVHHRT